MFLIKHQLWDDIDEDDVQWQEEFKVRVSSDFDRLVAFATEMNKTRPDVSPKRESEAYVGDYRSHIKKDESRKMKNEKVLEPYPERRIRMMMEEQSRNKHLDQ